MPLSATMLVVLTTPFAALAGLVLSYVVLLVVYGVRIHWRYRHIPGPPPNLLLGNIPSFNNKDLYLVAHEYSKKYGSIFTVWLGQRPLVWINDMDLITQLGIKRFSGFTNRAPITLFSMPSKAVDSLHKEVLFARNPLWGSLRAALQPLFHSSSLEKYAPIINDNVVKLCGYFERLAVPAGQSSAESTEVWRPLGTLTMDVIAEASLGCNMGALNSILQPGAKGKTPWLVAAAEDVFASADLDGINTLLQLLGPQGLTHGAFTTLWLKLVRGEKQIRLVRGRSRLFAAARSLYHNSLQRLAAKGEQVPAPDDSWVWWKPEEVEGNPCKDVVPDEGSLPDLLAKAKSKTGSEGLTELECVTNIYEMLAAGYETTATTVAYALYGLASNKTAETKLLNEIDQHPADWAPSFEEVSSLPYLDAVIKETLRVFPVVTWTNREAAEDCKVGGVLVPKHSHVVFAIYSVLKDPVLFPDPEAFKPERWLKDDPKLKPVSTLAFGIGPRSCIGMRLALEEAKITMVRLYQRLTFDVDMTYHANGLKVKQVLTVQPVDGVHLFPRLRSGAKP